MSRLSTFGRRQAGRLRSLTRRQAGVVAAVAALCAAGAAAGLTGFAGVAAALLAVLLGAVLAGTLLLARRVGGMHRANLAAHRDLRTVVDQLQRRVVAAVERERLAAGDRHLEVTEALARAQRTVERGTARLQVGVPREVEATVQLFRDFTPRAPMPSSGDYALNPTDLLELLHLVRTRRPRLVLELGSGTSSVWLAYALEATGGRLVSLDHDPAYARRTRAALAAHGLTGVAEVREAPLTPVELDGRAYPWYDRAALADLTGVDFVVVDGPPAATGPDARLPALHVLADKLADTATVVFDDANRRDEQAALQRWTQSIDGLTREGELLGRHAVLAYARPAPAVAAAP